MIINKIIYMKLKPKKNINKYYYFIFMLFNYQLFLQFRIIIISKYTHFESICHQRLKIKIKRELKLHHPL